MTDPIIIDAHEDLAWNMLTFGRDYTQSAAETRQRETDALTRQVNERHPAGLAGLPAGKVAVVFSTLFAAPERYKLGEWDRQCYSL